MYRIVIIIELLEIFLRIQFMLNMYWRSGESGKIQNSILPPVLR